MKVLYHHIYEYKKGLRNLVLHTLSADLQGEAEKHLKRHKIPYIIRWVNNNKINVFFGAKECVDIIAAFGDKPLNKFTHEEDFILGIMLGYSRLEQCKRYIRRSQFQQVIPGDYSIKSKCLTVSPCDSRA
ncbi:MAG: DUF2023 family protein [Spirochaetes bacterium]|nr:DUF2023 family protein [Spirochaetota bacterium]